MWSGEFNGLLSQKEKKAKGSKSLCRIKIPFYELKTCIAGTASSTLVQAFFVDEFILCSCVNGTTSSQAQCVLQGSVFHLLSCTVKDAEVS